ncbi:TPA: hypothetical protein NNV62_003797 [Salmonella enterica]|nr:hypothetical protein [Salmonella enterica]
MSFFAGKYTDGKTVLSLNRASGGDINVHYSPNTNSIFHSDMPHMFVKRRFQVGLGNAGNGYFTGALPSDLSYLLANRANVILPVLVVRDNADGTEYYHQMTGIQRNSTYRWRNLYENISIWGQYTGSIQFDLNLEWGYWKQGGAVWDQIGNYGTGGHTIFDHEGGEDYVADAYYDLAGGWIMYQWRDPQDWYMYTNWIPRAQSRPIMNYEDSQNLVNPDYMHPLGPSSSVYDAVYVRAGGARCATGMGDPNAYGNTAYTKVRNLDFPYQIPMANSSSAYLTAGAERHVANARMSGFSEVYYPFTPVRMEYLWLNVTFDNYWGYSAENLFTGNDIKIAKDSFIIKGVDLRNTNYEMLAAVSTGTPSISNTYFSSNVFAWSSTEMDDGGAFRFFGANAWGGLKGFTGSNTGSTVGNSTPWNIGLYRLPQNSNIEINSPQNKIAINGVDIWSPNVRPLHLFTQNKANNIILGDNGRLYPMAYGETRLINTVDVGLGGSPEPSTILLSIEWMGNSLCDTDGDVNMQRIGNNAAGGAGSGPYVGAARRLTKYDYDAGDGVSHQIVVLHTNTFVPILTTNTISYAGGAAGAPRNKFQYYIRKNASNILEFWVTSRALPMSGLPVSYTPWVQYHKLRLNIQRLT